MRPKTLGVPFIFLYFSWIIFPRLSPKMRRFEYSGIRQETCEGKSCSSPLGESSVAASRLMLVGGFTLLECLTWWICPNLRAPSPVEGLGVYELAYIPRVGLCSSVMSMGEAWGSDPGGISQRPGFGYYSCQASMGTGMIDYLLRCHYFSGVKFSCLVSSEWSSTRFFQFTVNVPFFVCSKVENVLSNTTWCWGGICLVLVLNNRSTDPDWNSECPR